MLKKSFAKNIKTNRNTVYPAQDPTANKYISGSGWKIFFFVVLCVLCFSLSFLCLLCSYMYLFDCECKSFKRLAKNSFYFYKKI